MKSVVIEAGGTFKFDGGLTAEDPFLDTSVQFTLNSGGTVTSNNQELIDNQTTFIQLGGTNTANTLTVAGAASGTYDLRGGTLKAGTIAVNPVGIFTQTGGQANVTGSANIFGGAVTPRRGWDLLGWRRVH